MRAPHNAIDLSRSSLRHTSQRHGYKSYSTWLESLRSLLLLECQSWPPSSTTGSTLHTVSSVFPSTSTLPLLPYPFDATTGHSIQKTKNHGTGLRSPLHPSSITSLRSKYIEIYSAHIHKGGRPDWHTRATKTGQTYFPWDLIRLYCSY